MARMAKVRAAPAGVGGGNGPFWTAVREGLFAKHGLDLEVVRVPGSTPQIARALASGELDIATVPGPALVMANLQGADLVMVLSLAVKLVFAINARSEIRSATDLSGKRLGIGSHGNTDEVLFRWYVRRNGLNPDTEAIFVDCGSGDGVLASLEEGRIDAMSASPPTSTLAATKGFPALVDFAEQDIDYQLGGFAVSRQMAREERDVVLRFLRAWTDGMRLYRADKTLALQVLLGYTGISDLDVLETTWRVFAERFLDVPYPSLRGLATVLEEIRYMDPRARAAKPEDFVDSTFLAELEAEGFSASTGS